MGNVGVKRTVSRGGKSTLYASLLLGGESWGMGNHSVFLRQEVILIGVMEKCRWVLCEAYILDALKVGEVV